MSIVLEQRAFARVVELNEAAKLLLLRSFQVNLLALDAMVQSKRGGGALRGFDEVSSQMRLWSRELHGKLEQLLGLSAAIVTQTSMAAKQGRLLELLAEAARVSSNSTGQQAHERHRQQQLVTEHAMARNWRSARDLLGDLDQLGMMACVLSRSAMIEAASAESGLREQLSAVSSAFYANAQAVVDILKALLKALDGR